MNIVDKYRKMCYNVKKEKRLNQMQYSPDVILRAYDIIDKTAGNNAVIEAVGGGLLGPLGNLVVDVATIGTHYFPMINKIRALFNKKPWELETYGPVIKSLFNDLMFDIIFDKVLGSVPVVGIYFNYICAKSMIFRVGMLCAMTSCLEDDITDIDTFRKTSILIKDVFPQKSVFKFAKPDYNTFKKLMSSVINNDIDTFENKVNRALDAFDTPGDSDAR